MTFKKDDAQKPRYDLIPPHAELELAHVLTMGAEKYGASNWHQGGLESKPRYIAAAQRHIAAYRRGETHDPESGRHHLAHAVASLMFAMELGRPSVEEMHGDAVEGGGPSPIWTLSDGTFTLNIYEHKWNCFATLSDGMDVLAQHAASDPVDCMRLILKQCGEGGSLYPFMTNAIAAYERESGVGE